MNKLFFTICFTTLFFSKWETDFSKALQMAKQKHQLILINFSGSDWCGPCMRMRKEIFDDNAFSKMADTTMVIYNADFPRNKKNLPTKEILKENEILADKYDPKGLFPYTVLINYEGKIIKVWDGLPRKSAEEFSLEVKSVCDANK